MLVGREEKISEVELTIDTAGKSATTAKIRIRPWFHVKIKNILKNFRLFRCFILTWNHVSNEIK